MGWCSGSEIAEDLWRKIRKYIPEEMKYECAKAIYDVFCDNDADCWVFEPDSLAAMADPNQYEAYQVDFPDEELELDDREREPKLDACCENEDRDINGGCKNCGDPCL